MTAIRVAVGAAIRLRPTEELGAGLRSALQFPNPAFVQRERRGFWLGRTPKFIECYSEDRDGTLELPRGAADLLIRNAKALDLALGWDNRTLTLPELDLAPAVGLRDYQHAAMGSALRFPQGCIVMPCGSGKTVVGAAIIRAARQPALVLVHQLDLIAQWREKLEGCGAPLGVFGGGHHDVQPITIATIQTLATLSREAFADLAGRFGLVILDEAHHAPAASFASVLHRLPARRRYGLTATPDRTDGLGKMLDFYVGPRLFDIGTDELVTGGFLLRPEVRIVRTGFAYHFDSDDDPTPETVEEEQAHRRRRARETAKMMDALFADAARNALIVRLARDEVAGGHTVLVLTGRVEHTKQMAEALRAEGVAAEAQHAKVGKKKRAENVEQTRGGELQVLVATTIADEGLDLPRLDRVILAAPIRAAGRVTQRIGRLLRPKEGKATPVAFDLVDDVGVLHGQARARRKVYAEIGAEVKG